MIKSWNVKLSASGLSPLHFEVFYPWQGGCRCSTKLMHHSNLLILIYHCNADKTASVDHCTYQWGKMQQRSEKEKNPAEWNSRLMRLQVLTPRVISSQSEQVLISSFTLCIALAAPYSYCLIIYTEGCCLLHPGSSGRFTFFFLWRITTALQFRRSFAPQCTVWLS